MGGEKLHRLHIIFCAVLIAGAGLFNNNLNTLFAQSEDTPEFVAPAAEPNPESLIVFDGSGEGEEITAPGTLSGFATLRVALVLALSAAAIYGVVFFLRRLAKPPVAADLYLKVLARTPLGSGGSVAVVSVGTRAWLVGAADGGVSLIAELTDQELVDAMLLDNSRNGGGGGSKPMNFSALLRRLGGGGNGKRLGAGDLRKRRERLDKL